MKLTSAEKLIIKTISNNDVHSISNDHFSLVKGKTIRVQSKVPLGKVGCYRIFNQKKWINHNGLQFYLNF